MTARAEQLIEELAHNAAASGNKVLEQRLADLTLWYHRNRHDIPIDNLASRCAFLEKTIWILLEVAALQTERLHELEHGGAGRDLWLPRGMNVKGSVKEYG